jgi:hypothetical protein
VGHYHFVPVQRARDAIDRAQFPALCYDAPGVDRQKVQHEIAESTLDFFNQKLGDR